MILVTGATGALGGAVTAALVERGDRVAVLLRDPADAALLGELAVDVEHRTGDVRDPAAVHAAVRGADAVLHLAGIAGLSAALAGPMHEVNVIGAGNVARAARAAGARLVHTSSVSAVGVPLDGEPADEDFVFNGHLFGHPYMLTKRAGEQLVLDEVRRGLDAVVLNPSAVMTPGGHLHDGWAGFVAAVGNGRFPLWPSGGTGVVAGADLAAAQLLALDKGRAGERYIVNGENLDYRELITLAAEATGARPPRWPLPDRVLPVLARAAAPAARLVRDPARRPLLAPENVPYFTHRLFYDATKARTELGFTPTPVRAAVAQVAQWCADRGLSRRR